MYLKITNFEKILEAPHPLYTCIGCEEKANQYFIDVAHDEDMHIYTISIDRNQDKKNFESSYAFRVSGTNVQNGFDYGYLKVEDLYSRPLLFKLLCQSIEEIKLK